MSKEFQDKVDQTYFKSRQEVLDYEHPLNSIMRRGNQEQWLMEQGLTPKEISAETKSARSNDPRLSGAVGEPFIDPVSAFTGGFAGAGKMAISKGLPLAQVAAKALASGLSGAVAEVPIGTAAEISEAKIPGSGAAVAVVGGMLSGMTIENRIEDAVTAFVSRSTKTAGKEAAKVLPGTVEATLESVQKNLAEGKVEDEATAFVRKHVEDSIQADKIASIKESFGLEHVGEKPPIFKDAFAESPEKAYNINLLKIDTESDVKKFYSSMSDSFKEEFRASARGKITNQETVAASEKVSLEKILGREVGQSLNAEEAYAARKSLVTSGEQVVNLARKISGMSASDADKIKFRKAVVLHKALQEQVTGATAEAGRALQQYKIQAKSDKLMLRNIDEVIRRMGDEGDLTDSIAKAVSNAADDAHLNKMIDGIMKSKTSDVVMEVWINGLLSGPQTHSVNILSNTLTAMIQVPERFVSAGFSKVLKTGTDGVKFGEAQSQVIGALQGFKDMMIAAGVGFKNSGIKGMAAGVSDVISKDVGSLGGKIEVPRPRAISSQGLELSGWKGRAADYIGNAVRIPGTLLDSSDSFFKFMGYRMELNAQAYRLGASNGLSGDELARGIKEFTSNPPDTIKLASIDAAQYQTFTKALTGWTADFQKFAAKHPFMRVVTPFIRTPVNIMSFAIERSPFAPLLKGFRADIAAGGARRDLALGRLTTGSMIMASAATYASAGVITGQGPNDTRLRQSLRETGWQPYSLKIGDKYYSYGRLEPLGSILGVAADFSEMAGDMENTTAEEMAVNITASVAKNVTSKTFLRGVTELIQALEDPERYGDNYIQNYFGSLVPTGLAQVARIVDPDLREVKSIMDKIKSRIPGLSDTLPPRVNIWGEPIRLGGGLGPDIISPIYTSESKGDEVDNEIVRLKVPLSMPSKQIGGVELTSEQYIEYVRTAANPPGQIPMKDAMMKLISSPQYTKMSDGPDGMKSYAIRGIVQSYQELARGLMQKKHEDLRNKIITKKKARFAPQINN